MNNIKKILKNEYFILTLLILLTSMVLFYKFIFGSSVLAYLYTDIARDTMDQYIPVFEYYTKGISLYNFSYGMGTSAFASLNWVAEPLPALMILIASVIGTVKIPLLVVYMQISKILIGGIFCYKYLKLFNFSKSASMISAYIFAFCGSIIISGQHYQFATVAIYFLIILYFIEKTLQKKINFIFLTITVFLASLLSPGFVFFILLSAGVYSVARIIQKNKKISLMLKEEMVLVGAMLFGLLIAMCIFLPSLNEIVNISSRLGTGTLSEKISASLRLLSFEEIKTGFLRLFSGNLQGGTNSWSTNSPYLSVHFSAIAYCYTPLLVLTLVQYFRNTILGIKTDKKNMIVRLFIIVLLITPFLVGFIPGMSNFFANIDYRFVYIYEPLFAIVVANSLDNIKNHKFSRLLNLITVVVSVICVSLLFTFESDISKIAFCVSVFTLVLMAILLDLIYTGKVKKMGFVAVFVVMALGLLADNGISTYAGRHALNKSQLEEYQGVKFKDLIEDVASIEGDNFYRVDRTFEDTVPSFMMSLIIPSRTTSIYNGVLNGDFSTYLMKFHNTNSYSQVLYSGASYGTIFDTVTASTLGLKYIVTQNYRELADWSLVKEKDGYYIYENDTINSAGLLYSNYITESDYDKLTSIEKKFISTHAVVVPDNSKKMNGNQIKNIEYQTIATSILGEYQEKEYIIPINNEQIYKAGQQNLMSLVVSSGKDTKISVGIATKSGIISCDNYYWNMNTTIYSDNQEVLVYVPTDATKVIITTESSDIVIENINLYSANVNYSNDNIELTNTDMENRLDGRVVSQKDSILYLPVIYENGWKAYVNGEEVSIVKTNYGFSSINIAEGESNIELVYSNLHFKVGIIISMVSLAIFVSIILIYIVRKKKAGK